jgi:hypothetical protein
MSNNIPYILWKVSSRFGLAKKQFKVQWLEPSALLRLIPVADGSARPLGAIARWSGTTARPRRRGRAGACPVGWYRSHYCLPLGLAGGSDTAAHDWSVWIEIWSFEYEFDWLNLKN